ncbi:MAG: MCE family protein [Muribaculaceae bacterium]|nr:MCE family protein [Muribaculaceae bacterium]
MKSIFRKELLIGVFIVVALVILFFGINFLKGINLFKAANYFYATYDNVEGLAQSAPVTLNGYKIGLIREINYNYNNPGHITVELSIDKKLHLPKGSTAVVVSDILGTSSIALSLGNAADGYHAIGDTIASANNPGMMAALSDNLMPAVNAIFPKIDTLLTSLNAIAADPAIPASVKRLDNITSELEGSLHALRNTLAALSPITQDLKSITTNVDTITGNLSQVSTTINDANIDSLLFDLRSTVANLESLTAQLNSPDSSIGKLTHDPALYDNINSTVASLDSLFVDIKQNPKRYINIKVF